MRCRERDAGYFPTGAKCNFILGKCNAASDIRKNQRGGAVKCKKQHKNCVCAETDGDGQFFPELCKEAGEHADPENPGNSEAQGGIETDISFIIERIAAVIPVAQIPYRVEEPPNQKFQSGADEQREKERPDGVVFCDAREQDIKKNAADAVDGQPGAVKKTAVRKAAVLYEEDGNFPEKASDRAQKEKENLLGDKLGGMILLRWTEFGEIR